MQTDLNLIFQGGSNFSALAITNTAVGSSGVYDMATGLQINTGSVTTYAASPVYTGQGGLIGSTGNSLFGEDLGNGPWRLYGAAMVGTAFSGGTSLNIAWQSAPDASAGTYPANLSGLTWTTLSETGPIPQATFTAAGANSMIPLPDLTRRMLGASMPRFIRLYFTPVGTFSTGTISFAGLVMPRPDFDVRYYPSGFSVGA